MKKNGKKEKGQNGSVTRYIYSAAGEKLRVTYLTAVPNITVPIGTARELAPSEILAADSTDYLLGGTLTMKNGAQLGSQRVGTITGSYDDFSFSFSNDIIGDGKDRFRSNAIEIGYGDFSIGTYVCTNDGMKESGYQYETWDEDKKTIKKRRGNQAWPNGVVHTSPIWIGYKKGNMIQRVGINAPFAQQATQNLLHKIINYPQYNKYMNSQAQPYFHIGTNNPLSLW